MNYGFSSIVAKCNKKELGEIAWNRRESYTPNENDPRPYVGLEHITSGRPLIREFGDSSKTKSQKNQFMNGDVLFGKLRPYLRKVAIAKIDGVCSTDILVLNSKDEVAGEYLLYILSSPIAISYSVRYSAGTKMPRTSWASLKKLQVPVPSKHIQNIVTTIMTKIDRLIDSKYKYAETLIQYRRGLLRYLLAQGFGTKEIRRTRINQKNTTIPLHWQVAKLKDISRVKRGASPRPIDDTRYFGGNVGWVRIADVHQAEKYLRKTKQYLSDLGVERSVRVFPGEVILSICGSVGSPCIVDMDACIHDGIVAFKNLSDKINNEYLYYVLQNLDEDLITMKQTGTQSNLNSQIVEEVEVPIPTPKEQEDMVHILSCIDYLILKTNEEIHQFDLFRSHLLNSIFKNRFKKSNDFSHSK